MRVRVIRGGGGITNHHNVKGLSVSDIRGRDGELVLITSYDLEDGVERIPKEDWESLLIVKDMEIEKV